MSKRIELLPCPVCGMKPVEFRIGPDYVEKWRYECSGHVSHVLTKFRSTKTAAKHDWNACARLLEADTELLNKRKGKPT